MRILQAEGSTRTRNNLGVETCMRTAVKAENVFRTRSRWAYVMKSAEMAHASLESFLFVGFFLALNILAFQ